jgi:hypothetical protein
VIRALLEVVGNLMLIEPTTMLLNIVTIIGLSINLQVGDHNVPRRLEKRSKPPNAQF